MFLATELSKFNPNIRVLENPARLSSAGRNIGARVASGDVILFVDGHCEIPDRLLLRNLSELFSRTSADVICRPQPLEQPDEKGLAKAIALARSSWLGHNPSSFIFSTSDEGFVSPDSSGAAYNRSVFDRIGYYDESFDACEDVDFNLRARKAGLRAYTSPRVTIRYYPRENLGSLLRQMYRYGTGRARLFLKHPKDAARGAMMLGAPPVLLAGLALAGAFSRTALLSLRLVICVYLLLLVTVSSALSGRSGLRLAPSIFGALLATHAGLFAGFWSGLVASRRQPRRRGRET